MLPTIPASQLVNVIPGVISAGGAALQLSGLLLTTSTRVPIGQVLSFPSQLAVSAYFGPASQEATEASAYFGGYDNSTAKPAAMLFAQYPTAPLGVTPWTRGASVGSMSLAQLQAIAPGTLSVTVNGHAWTSASINLSTAVSFSDAASKIQTALAANDASFTGAIAAATFSVTGSILANQLVVTAVASGVVVPGATISGSGVASGTTIVGQLSGTPGGIGTYIVTGNQSIGSETISGAYGTLTVSAVAAGALAVGQAVAGAGVTAGTYIGALGTGAGQTGTYFVNASQTVASEALTSGALAVTFDSVSNAFVITGGTPGTPGTIGYASGTIAEALSLAQDTGAILSQGAPQGVPATNMAAIEAQTTNWFSFTTTWEPSIAEGLAFAAWTNATVDEFCFIAWDTDASPAAGSAPSSLGAQIVAAGYSGTLNLWEAAQSYKASMVMGFFASFDFSQQNGRPTLAFRAQSGMTADVTSAFAAANLQANGYNYYGSYSTAAQNFTFLYPGSLSGPFKWADSYACQAWMNSQFQLDLMELLTIIPSVPYNNAGYALMEESLSDTIAQAVSFGAIRQGVTLSANQINAVNNAAGLNIAPTLQARGWYLQILDPGAQVRANRGTPKATFWYTDGGAVQKITLSSQEVQ